MVLPKAIIATLMIILIVGSACAASNSKDGLSNITNGSSASNVTDGSPNITDGSSNITEGL